MTDTTIHEKLRRILQSAPKPQLHLHLDGSISLAFIKKSIERMKKDNPKRYKKLYIGPNESLRSQKELYEWLMTMKEEQIKAGSVAQKNSNWKVFDFCNQFLQTTVDLHEATYDLVTKLYEDHRVNYIEIRFAPILHVLNGLTIDEVVIAVLDGFDNAKNDLAASGHKIEGGIIVCALRSYPLSQAQETLELAVRYKRIVGFDIAGDEGTYPLVLFSSVLESAKKQNIKTTVHSGEWSELKNPQILDNLTVAAECQVNRIGHGLALRSASSETMRKYEEASIYIEVCLTANCGNPNKCRSFSEHPINLMLTNDLRVAALNCDNLLLSGSKLIGSPDPTSELIRALLDCRIQPKELLMIVKNGYEAGFHQGASQIGQDSLKIWNETIVPCLTEILTSSA